MSRAGSPGPTSPAPTGPREPRGPIGPPPPAPGRHETRPPAAPEEQHMSIFVDENTEVVVQGIGSQGTFHAKR
ncbi:MAG: hypothetical protein R6U94_15115, partial [Nitriliruptoraceae bacterium]